VQIGTRAAWRAAPAPIMDGMVRVTILPDREVQEVDAATVSDVLVALGLHRDAHLVVRGEDILTSDTRLTETDELEIVPVISGGRAGGGH
jgi:sulfur carrier protein